MPWKQVFGTLKHQEKKREHILFHFYINSVMLPGRKLELDSQFPKSLLYLLSNPLLHQVS